MAQLPFAAITSKFTPAVTNARFASPPQAAGRPLSPLDRARSASPTARSSRAALAAHRIGGGLPFAARRRALRSGSDSLCAPVCLPSTWPVADRRPKPRGTSSSASSDGIRPGTPCRAPPTDHAAADWPRASPAPANAGSITQILRRLCRAFGRCLDLADHDVQDNGLAWLDHRAIFLRNLPKER